MILIEIIYPTNVITIRENEIITKKNTFQMLHLSVEASWSMPHGAI